MMFSRCLCQVHLHSHEDIPLVSDLGFFVEPGKHSLVSVDYSRVSQHSSSNRSCTHIVV